ncbi:hypothetical protein WJX82_003802 [Trebouxia sp. C0006]
MSANERRGLCRLMVAVYTRIKVMFQMAHAHMYLPAAQQAPVPKQPAAPAAVPPPNKKKSVKTAPNIKKPDNMKTFDIHESRGAKARGGGEARD